MKKIYILYFLFFCVIFYFFYKKYLKNEGFELIKSCNDFCGLQGKLNIDTCDKYNNNKYIKCKNYNGQLVTPHCLNTNRNNCI
jgi:hypothetical protein